MPNRSPSRCCYAAFLAAAAFFTTPPNAGADDFRGEFHLRGYRGIRQESQRLGEASAAIVVHRFVFDDARHAQWFVSKLYADFALTQGNRVKMVTTAKGPADAIDLGSGLGGGLILPLLAADAREVTVVTGAVAETVLRQADRRAAAAPLRNAALSHPLYLDKWDRYPLGCWNSFDDFERNEQHNTLDSFYEWMAKIGITAQLNTGYLTQDLATNDNILSLFRKYWTRHRVNYQRVEWLANQIDLFNRNPFLTTGPNPHVALRGDYYGERCLAGNPLRAVQMLRSATCSCARRVTRTRWRRWTPTARSDPMISCTGASTARQTAASSSASSKRCGGLSLEQVSRRYTGRRDAYRSWNDVPQADWRRFYGWTDGAEDLAGPWRFERDDKQEGFARGWSLPNYDDRGWIRLHYPGDAPVFGLPQAGKPLWMRATFTPKKSWPGRVYLSLAPLSRSTVQVFLNGTPLGAIDPRFHTAWTWGQFDVTDEVRKGGAITLALRFAAHDYPQGPIFLTPRRAEDFPTADPQVNALRWDHMEFIDWALAQAAATTLDTLRSVDPDRPIKVHAYGGSPWGWDIVAKYGGYSHHTGSGARLAVDGAQAVRLRLRPARQFRAGRPDADVARIPRHLGQPDLHGQERPRLLPVRPRHHGGPGQAGLPGSQGAVHQAHGPGQRAFLARGRHPPAVPLRGRVRPLGNVALWRRRRPAAARWSRCSTR